MLTNAQVLCLVLHSLKLSAEFSLALLLTLRSKRSGTSRLLTGTFGKPTMLNPVTMARCQLSEFYVHESQSRAGRFKNWGIARPWPLPAATASTVTNVSNVALASERLLCAVEYGSRNFNFDLNHRCPRPAGTLHVHLDFLLL